MSAFKPGDIVRHNGGFGVPMGVLAVVVDYNGRSYKLKFDDPELEAKFRVKLDYEGGRWSDHWLTFVRNACPPFDPNSPVRQRCGRPALIVLVDGFDDARPVKAKVEMKDGSTRVLSYSKTGYFYKSIESDVDLVNK